MNAVDLGPFQVVERLAEGGMGAIYRGVHRATGVTVALKFIRPERVDEDSLRDFEREIRTQARLDHPGIVHLFDHGRLSADVAEKMGMPTGSPWLAMEYCSETLIEAVPNWTWPRIRAAIVEILNALGHAHAVGVLHRDLKFSNVLLATAEDLRPGLKLVDFGIAHLLDDEDETTRQVGTPRYMAPEQVMGTWENLGPWTDLYALGVLVWRMITGRRPWPKREGASLAYAMLNESLGRPGSRIAIPEGLWEWIEIATAKSPGARFSLASDASRALLSLDGLPGPSISAPPPESESGPQMAAVGLGLLAQRRPAMIGRHVERRAAWDALKSVVDSGCSGTLCVVGPAHIGRARFEAWLCESAERVGLASNFRVSFVPERSVSEQVVQALRTSLRLTSGMDQDAIEARLEQRAGTFPELPDLARMLDSTEPAGPDWIPTLAAGVRAFGRVRARLIAIRGMRHAPHAIGFARAVAATGAPVLIVVDEPVDGWPLLNLGPLPDASLRRLANSLLPLEPNTLDDLVGRADGSPGFVVESLIHWALHDRVTATPSGFQGPASSRVPTGLEVVAEVRLASLIRSLSDRERRSLERASLLGRSVRWSDWQIVDGPGREAPRLAVVEALERRGLIEPELDGFAFVSTSFRVVLMRSLAARRVHHHRQIAERLHDAGRALAAGPHWLGAGDVMRALVPLRDGVEASLSRDGDASFTGLLTPLEEAVETLEGPERLRWTSTLDQIRAGVWLRRGELAAAEEAWTKAHRTAEVLGDPALLARCWARRGEIAVERGDVEVRKEAYRRALSLVETGSARACVWWMEEAKAHLASGDRERWAECMGAASAATPGDPTVWTALGRAAQHQIHGEWLEALEAMDLAEERAAHDDPSTRLCVARARAHTLVACNEWDAASEAFDQALLLAAHVRVSRVSVVLANRIWLELEFGSLDAAWERFERYQFVLPAGQDVERHMAPAHAAGLCLAAFRQSLQGVRYHLARWTRHEPWGWASLNSGHALAGMAVERLGRAGHVQEARKVAAFALRAGGAAPEHPVRETLARWVGGASPPV